MSTSDRHDIVSTSGSRELAPASHDEHGAAVEHERPEDWGWHHEWRSAPIVGWFMTIVMLLLILGNHRGNIENWWLVGLAAVMAFILIRDQIRRRNSWRS